MNILELEWEDQGDGPSIYHTRSAELARPLGARKLGYHLEILPPGTALCPYHAHLVNEELFLVLGGEMSVRLDGREHALAAGDLVAVPPGPSSAHQLLNRNDRPAHLLAASTMIPREVVDYPDSGKRLFRVNELAPGDREKKPATGGRAGGLDGGGPAFAEVDGEAGDGKAVDGEAGDGKAVDGEAGGAAPPETAARMMVRAGREASYYDGEPTALPPAPAPDAEVEPDRRIVRPASLGWQRFGRGQFGGERKRLGRAAGARLLGYGLYRLLPGQRPWAFHFHHVNEEFFYVRSGYGRLRTRDAVLELGLGHAFACQPGPAGAHQIAATGDRPLEVFALSTVEQPEVTEYPDSGKLYVMVDSAPGGAEDAREVDAIFRIADAVDYLAGEA